MRKYLPIFCMKSNFSNLYTFICRCYNGGKCRFLNVGLRVCQCPPGFGGRRCIDCDNLKCENGGICSIVNGTHTCKCPTGYEGSSCEKNICGKHGIPVAKSDGTITCSCMAGYTGEKCIDEDQVCRNLCQNGGTCKLTGKQPECICPKYFKGRRCEINMCLGKNPPEGCKCNCLNGGDCMFINQKFVCRCPESWGGYNCEVSLIFAIDNEFV